MKRLLSVVAIICFTLVGGLLLSACGEPDFYRINVESNALFDVDLLKGQEILIIEEGETAYVVENDANVTVKLYAKNLTDDFSNVHVQVNGVEKELFLNGEFNFEDNGDKYYGWFTLPMKKLKSNVSITFLSAAEPVG